MTVAWIGVDWGTTALRAWALAPNGDVLDMRTSALGMAKLQPGQAFETALLGVIEGWLPETSTIQIVICGMAGAKQGWSEAPYRTVPTRPVGKSFHRVETHCSQISVAIILGLCQLSPADVMRGEETQIAGFCALNSEFSGAICLPGTHSKWAQIEQGKVVGFQTFLSGELFALLKEHSILRTDMLGNEWDQVAFARTVACAFKDDFALQSEIFRLRAQQLLSQSPVSGGQAALSGLLIGAELAATKRYWLDQPIGIVGTSDLATHYATALRQMGADPIVTDSTAATLTGLTQMYQTIQKDRTCHEI